jgi:dipeptidyl-peptidase 4
MRRTRSLSAPPALLAFLLLGALPSPPAVEGQVPSRRSSEAGFVGGAGSANWMLAARFAPYRVEDMVHSLTVEPNWIEGSERFWYEWENADGTFYYIVDPERGTKEQLFDNDRIAAELTRITRDPWDGQHLPIRNIRFIDDDTFQFDVESSQDEEPAPVEQDEEEQRQEEDEDDEEDERKRIHYFEYTVSTQTLRELEDYEAPDDHPDWASVSPDGQTVIFAKNHDLWMMSGEDYERILDARRGARTEEEADEAEDDVEVEEIRLTTDGEEFRSYQADASGRGETNVSARRESRRSETRRPFLGEGFAPLRTRASRPT